MSAIDEQFLRAAANNNLPLMRVRVASGASVAAVDPGTGRTALQVALSSPGRQKDVCSYLLEAGAPIALDGSESPKHPSALHSFAELGWCDLVERVLSSGYPVDCRHHPEKSTPLMRAAHLGQAEAVKLLLALGADANAKDLGESRPLHYARSAPVIQALVGAGGDIGALNRQRQSALVRGAKWLLDAELMSALLNNGADPNETFESTPVLLIAARMDIRTMLVLLDAGANPAARDGKGRSFTDVLKGRWIPLPERKLYEAYRMRPGSLAPAVDYIEISPKDAARWAEWMQAQRPVRTEQRCLMPA